ncbi:dihydrolipoamide acetyltransferase family protein [Sulfurimonas autotrophica]|uniref:Dihydrolipoamide acetyltransferase component of pyruvate dehydrogenase complex n=1 Tax=Sulfurimonas autotrophica (strain ATCC BAA-671 / DSM 16294 / JCM 11897 / OK10) TaxID=563040 RepID=E0UPL6_SULAO|nr:dihydrolipoamide acetyltransferase family protein [Sulfurimonas autotrophica]ADN08608.1 catalytic domain of components of various dehydrogenase complexes [Sulfurimonas autotrophica DSM 16294]
MSTFVMPSLGADMESAVLMEWKVKEGDKVKKGDIIAEVETSKGVIEIEVFEDGIVEKLLVEPETECKVGDPIALIHSDNENSSEKTEQKVSQKIPKIKEEIKKEISQVKEDSAEEKRIKISPAARKKAKELGVNLEELSSHIKGKIQLSDIEKAVKKTQNTSFSSDGMRQAIAKAMSRSNAEIPHYYLSTSINMTPALQWLKELNAKRSINERILPAALMIRAVVSALKKVPELNGFWKDNAPQISDAINPGIAIALRKSGLITPAILNTQQMNLDDVMKSLSDLITRTRSGKLKGSEMTQQTVTITNLGDLGVESVLGVIYPPQVAIVGIGRIIDKPWAENDMLSVRKVVQVTLAGDHRATDGRTGAQFLDKLDKILQKPEELL